MPYTLNDLNLFNKIDDRMKLVTPEDLSKLKPGKPFPDGAVTIGKLSPALKALLYVCDKDSAEVTQMCKDIKIKFGQDSKSDQYLAELKKFKKAVDLVRRHNSLFRSAFEAEFPDHGGTLFYGHNFEVYELDLHA